MRRRSISVSIFANIFGFILNIINNLVGNYGLAIILFTVLIKLIMLPLSIKQQKTMKKSTKLQEKIKILQFKYKNDPEKLNREMMDLYKQEKMSPFSGCLSGNCSVHFVNIYFLYGKMPFNIYGKGRYRTVKYICTTIKR